MANWASFPAAGQGDPEAGAPAPERVLEGAPAFRTWSAYENEAEKLYCGVWEATPGTWSIRYDEWESFTLLAGHSIVTPDGGEPVHLRAGDSMVIEPGFSGTWRVLETTRKTYVIRL